MEELQQLVQSRPEIKAYLTEKLFPALTNSLEALLEELEFNKKRTDAGEELPPISPLLFIAQYLMRNNPNPLA